MKKFLLLTFTVLLSALSALAAPAYPYPVKITQPDGTTLTIRLYGDEWCNWTTTEDGYNVVINPADGFYYYDTPQLSFKARDIVRREASERGLLASVRCGASSEALLAGRIERTKALANIPAAATENHTAARARAAASGDKFHSLVILVNFSDKQFTVPNANQAFTNALNQDGYSLNGGTGSAWNYYFDNSNGRFDASFDVVGPVNIAQEWQRPATGTDNDKRYGNMTQLVQQACLAAKAAGVNFADYADNGYVRDIFIYYAGYNQAEGGARAIWAHRSGIPAYFIDGVYVSGYACSSELKGVSGTVQAGIGTFCHEFGHVLGWPDFYDRDYGQNGQAEDLYAAYALMGSGNYNNGGNTPPSLTAIERIMQSWLTPTPLITSGNYTLNHVSNDVAYVINTPRENDYFILEQRSSTNKWDAGIGSFSGILVSHIDQSTEPRADLGGNSAKYLWDTWMMNIYGAHPCAFLIKAAGTSNQTQWVFNSSHSTLSDVSYPTFKAWDGSSSNFMLTSIASSGNQASFTLGYQTSKATIVGKVVDFSGTPIAGATVVVTKQSAMPAPVRTGELQSRAIKRAATNIGDDWMVTTDAQGDFAVTDLAILETYEVCISKSGYIPQGKVVEIVATGVQINVALDKLGESPNRYSWHSDIATSVGANGNPLIVGARFTYADLNISGTANLKGMDLFLSGRATVLALVYKNNILVAQQPLGEVATGKFIYVDFSSQNITMSTGEDIIVAYQITNYTDYPIAASSSAINGKGNIYKQDINSSSWNAYNYNWLIGSYFVSTTPTPVTGMSFNSAPTTMYVGDIKPINYSFSPAGASSAVNWTYGTPGIAEVVNDGSLKGLKGGSTSVIASVNGNPSLAQFTVTVADEITDNPTSTLSGDESEATISWTPAVSRPKWTVSWKNQYDTEWNYTTATSAATTLTGVVKSCIYEVRIAGERLDGGFWGYKSIMFNTSSAPDVDHIDISDASRTIYADESYQLTAVAVPANAWNVQLDWSSSNESVATVDMTGRVSAIDAGTATITAKTHYGNVQATCVVTVVKAFNNIEMVSVLTNDALLSWEGSLHTGNYLVKLYAGNTPTGAPQFEATVATQSVYLPILKSNLKYTVVISTIGLTGGDGEQTRQTGFTTLQNLTQWTAMGGGIKGSYSAADDIPLRAVNLPTDVVLVAWSVDGSPVQPPVIHLSAGKHTIQVVITDSKGATETVTKVVDVR